MNYKSALFLGVGALALGALFVLLKPAAVSDAPVQVLAPGSASAVQVSVAPSNERVYDIEIKQGAKVSGADVMQATQGQEVVLTLRSDQSDELHVHGYDLHANIKAGIPETLRFKADRSGRFSLELHHSNLELGALEVRPR
jgi:hypothetical protein